MSSTGVVAAGGRLHAEALTTDTATQYSLLVSSTSHALTQFIRNSANNVRKNVGDSAPFVLVHSGARQASVVDTGTNVARWADGVSGETTAYTRTGTLAPDNATLGAALRSDGYQSKISGPVFLTEHVEWATALSTGQRQAGEANQKNRYATP